MRRSSGLPAAGGVEVLERRLGANAVLLRRARTHAHPADDLTLDVHRQAAADNAEVAAVGDVDAEGRTARHAQLVVHMRAVARDRAGGGLVDGDRNAADLAAVHA